MIEAHRKEDTLEISVMDNGVGMDQDSIDKILQLLQGDAPGIKNQYNWQSIGLKMFMTASAICTAKNMEFRLPVRSG